MCKTCTLKLQNIVKGNFKRPKKEWKDFCIHVGKTDNC